jgi:transaldolase
MKFFIDTANMEEIAEVHATGLLDGVTTNPTLIKQSGRNVLEVLKEIAKLVDGPISGEVAATDFEGMKREGSVLADLAENIAIKVPMTWDGLKACRHFANQGRMVNVTLCFSASQALLAAKAGAAFVSPFVGRLDDISADGLGLIHEICTIYDNYAFDTEVLVASVRNPLHVVESAKMGAHVATIPYKVMRQLLDHPLTDKGLAAFVKDWAATGQTIA